MNKKGLLIVLSGPSGVGKGTVRKQLFSMRSDLFYSVSCTTREPRDGEINGLDYNFITFNEFNDNKNNDKFLEYAIYGGNDKCYGTLSDPIYEQLNMGNHVILEIDPQGAFKIRDKHPETVMIFIVPPSWDCLHERLSNRKTEEQHIIKKRLITALEEFVSSYNYDYIVINDDIIKASEDINFIINIISENSENSEEILFKFKDKKIISEVIQDALSGNK